MFKAQIAAVESVIIAAQNAGVTDEELLTVLERVAPRIPELIGGEVESMELEGTREGEVESVEIMELERVRKGFKEIEEIIARLRTEADEGRR